MITDQYNYYCKDTLQLTSTSNPNVDTLTKKEDEVSSKLLQLREEEERLDIKHKDQIQTLTNNNKRKGKYNRQQRSFHSKLEQMQDSENKKDDQTNLMIIKEVD